MVSKKNLHVISILKKKIIFTDIGASKSSFLGFLLTEFVYRRHEFYQKPEEVVVTIFAKGIPAKNVAVVFGVQIVCCSLAFFFSSFFFPLKALLGKMACSKIFVFVCFSSLVFLLIYLVKTLIHFNLGYLERCVIIGVS